MASLVARPHWTGAIAALLCALSSACAPPRPVAVVPAVVDTPIVIPFDPAPIAELIALEDSRNYDAARLSTLVASSDPIVRRFAAQAVGRLERIEGGSLLRPLLADPDTAVAATAAFSLGEIPDTTAVAALAAILSNPLAAPTVAAEAAYALGKLRAPAAGAALTEFLSRADPMTAALEPASSALLAVWRFPRPEDLGPVARWLTAPAPELRWRAAYALVRRPDPRAARLLFAAAGDSDARVRALALRALTAPLVDSAALPRADVLRLLFAGLRDSDYTVRINAARTLGGHSDPAIVDSLAALLSGDDSHLAVTAMESLARLGRGAASAASRLVDLARTEPAHIFLRQTAIESLPQVDSALGRALALEMRENAHWRLRTAAGRALARVATPGTPELRALVADADSRVSAAVLQAAIDAAGDSLRRVTPLLLERVGSPDPFVRATALAAIARLEDPATLPVLLDAYATALRDTVNDAALAAIDALVALRSERLDPTRAFFARFPRSADYLVRRRVAEGFDEAAEAAWGSPYPVEPGRERQRYLPLAAAANPNLSDEGRRPTVTIATERGTLRLRLHADQAPLTVESFTSLASRGFFDGQEWPRVVANFVVQGGDPRGDTNGGPGYAIRDEINRIRYLPGTLGMALAGPDTGGSQFFITHSDQPHLDGIYTVFGELVGGMDVLQEILPGDRILSVRVDGDSR